MKKFPLFIMLALLIGAVLTSCVDSNSDIDTTWRDANLKFYQEQMQLKDANGNPYYKLIVAPWDANAQVLVHWFNDPAETAENLSPLYTSTVDVKYRLTMYDGTPKDSSFNLTTQYGDSIFRTKLTGVVSGWPIAITKMHIGDSCRVVVPHTQGYGIYDYGNIKGYSTLVFDIKLVGIPYYEAKP